MNETRNELAVTEDNRFLLDFASAQQSFCSLVPKTQEEKVSFFNLVNSPTAPLKKMINLEIEVSHVYAETIEFVDTATGESVPGVRMVLITPKGESYQACSKGVYSSLKKMLQIFGTPDTWKKPIKIRPKEVSKGADKNVLVFDIIG